ncbi:helix-turn-helix transcriptional regulator [Bacillus nakamurai]|uniref:helix-turn-helix domain-containing protein n=2 Tax=Bacillus nakamurai TaxID=1793963 RepID=UPI003084091F
MSILYINFSLTKMKKSTHSGIILFIINFSWSENNMTLGQRLKICRENLGWNQQQAANKIGISKNTLSNYERDLQRPRYVYFEKNQ